MTEAPAPPSRPSLLRRMLRTAGRTVLVMTILLALAALGITLHGRGNFEAGRTSAVKAVYLKALGFEGPIFTFWGKPMIWVEANGTHGYTGIGMDLEVFDLTSEGALRSLGVVPVGGMVHGLALSGNVLYASAGDAGLVVIDVSDPAHAKRVAKLPSNGYTFGIFLDEQLQRVYVTERSAGVRVFDVSKPLWPKLLGTFKDTEWSNDVVVDGTTAYIADGKLGLIVVDFEDPTAPESIGYMAMPGLEPALPPIDPAPVALELKGDVLYLAGVERDLVVVDVKKPAWPRVVSSLSLPGDTMDIRIDGERLYLAQEPYGLVIADISTPAQPEVIASLAIDGSAHTVAVAGSHHVLVGLLAQGAALVDVSDATAPRVVKRSPIEATARSVALAKGHALVAEGPGGLVVYALDDPERPRRVAWIPASDYVYDVRVSADRAYVAGGQQGLMILDLEDPTDPILLESFKTPEHAFSVSLADGRAYTAEGMYQFVGVRLDEPDGLRADAVGVHAGYGMAVHALGEERLLVGNFMNGLKLMEVASQDLGSLPFRQNVIGDAGPFSSNRQETGLEWLGPKRVMDMERREDLVFLAIFDGGLGILDVSSVPGDAPVMRSRLELGDYHFGVTVRDTLAAVAGHEQGLYLVDVSDPDDPTELARVETRDRAFGVALTKRYAYVADGSAGLTVIDISDPRAPRLLP